MRRVWLVVVAGGIGSLAVADSALAQPPPTAPPVSAPTELESGVTGEGVEGEPPPVTLPLVPVPVGCEAPPLPHVVFVGRVDERDFRSVRFEIEQIRAGDPQPFSAGDVIDVRYGLDAQYLRDGERYLVSAPVDPDLGLLVSRVTPPTEDFGGDEVIGVSESDVNCPAFDDPMRTLHLDGTPVAAGVIDPFLDAKFGLLGAVLVPLGIAFGLVFLLAALRLSVSGVFKSVSEAGRPTR